MPTPSYLHGGGARAPAFHNPGSQESDLNFQRRKWLSVSPRTGCVLWFYEQYVVGFISDRPIVTLEVSDTDERVSSKYRDLLM